MGNMFQRCFCFLSSLSSCLLFWRAGETDDGNWMKHGPKSGISCIPPVAPSIWVQSKMRSLLQALWIINTAEGGETQKWGQERALPCPNDAKLFHNCQKYFKWSQKRVLFWNEKKITITYPWWQFEKWMKFSFLVPTVIVKKNYWIMTLHNAKETCIISCVS